MADVIVVSTFTNLCITDYISPVPAKESASDSHSTPPDTHHTVGPCSVDSNELPSQAETNRVNSGNTEDLDPVFDAYEYYGHLDRLALETAQKCKIVSILTRTSKPSRIYCLELLRGCKESLENFQTERLCADFYNMFVEHEDRHVADTIIIYDT